jgi:hypothetical protein
LLKRLAKHDIDEERPGLLHIHYNADETGPDEDGYLFYRTEEGGTVRYLRRTYPCGRAADILNAIRQEFGKIYSEYDQQPTIDAKEKMQ